MDYSKLFNTNNLKQNIFDSYLYVKGDIRKFGNEKSTYKWYIDGQLIDLSTSVYDLSEYAGRTVKCEIIDGDITLTSNQVTLMDIRIKFENPPKSVIKGNQVKLSIIVEESQDYNLDKSVSWSVYNSTASSISTDGILNVPADETSKTITVRATSNFDNTEYAEIEIKILSPSEIDLKTDKASYTYGDMIVLNASMQESKAKAVNPNKISFYMGDTVLGTEEVVNNQASIQIDTKDLGAGIFNLKADFSGNDIFASSTANIDVIIDKANLNNPTNLKWNNTTVSFDKVDNCSEYQLEIFKNDTSLAILNLTTTSYNCINYFESPASYSFTIKALGNEFYNDSEAVKSEIYYYRLPSEIDLKTDKASYTYGDIIVLNASVQESKAKTANSNKISFYMGDTVLGTEEVVNNQVGIQIDTKDLGTGTFDIEARFSGSDTLIGSTANIDITVDKANLNNPTNLKWEGMLASFDKFKNCSEYQIQLFKDDILILTVHSTLLQYDFSKNLISSAKYQFSVKALGNDNYNDSQVTTSDIYNYSNTYYDNLQSAIKKGKKILDTEDANAEQIIEAIISLSESLKEFEAHKGK